jgi:hypothetical protein
MAKWFSLGGERGGLRYAKMKYRFLNPKNIIFVAKKEKKRKILALTCMCAG